MRRLLRRFGLNNKGYGTKAHRDAIMEHEWMLDWAAAAEAEPWVIERFER